MRTRKSILKRSSKPNLTKFTEEEITKQLSSLQTNQFCTKQWIGMTLLKRPSKKIPQRTSIQTPQPKKLELSTYQLETHAELEETFKKNGSDKTLVNERKKRFDYSFLNTITSVVRTSSNVIKNKTIRLSHAPVINRISSSHIPPPSQPPRRKSMFNKIQVQQIQPTIIKPVKRTLNKYEFGKLLGEGTYGKVHQCTDTQSGKIFALKQFTKNDPKTHSYAQKQITLLKKINHSNIVKYHDNFQIGKSNYIVMEHCGLYNLKVYVKERINLSENMARPIFMSLAKSIKYLHGKLIVHRDIKLENILIKQDDHVKLIDFGFSQQLESQYEELHNYCGTPTYMSPEIIRKTPYSGFKADCWALGMILYYMISGAFPFTCRDEKSLFNAILRSTIPINPKLSSSLRKLLRGMLTLDSDLRFGIDDILDHQWCR